MKKLRTLLLWIIIMGSSVIAFGNSSKTIAAEQKNNERAEKVLVVRNSYNQAEMDGLFVSKNIAGNNGPRDYAIVKQNDILILQTSKQGFLRYIDGQYQKTYFFQKAGNYEHLETDGKYAYAIGWDNLLRIDLSTGEEESYHYPSSLQGHVPTPVWDNGTLVLQEESCGNYCFDEILKEFEQTESGFHVLREDKIGQSLDEIHYSDFSWTLDSKEKRNRIVAVDKNDNLIVHIENDTSEREKRIVNIQKITTSGDILMQAEIDLSNHLFIPFEPVKMQRDNNIYVMCVYEPYTMIYVLPEEGKCKVSAPEFLAPIESEIPLTERIDWKQDDKETGTRGNISNDLMPMPSSRTRQNVLNSAEAMRTLQWTLRTHNMGWVNVYEDGQMIYTRPAYLSGKTNGSLIYGIPYAWNKMNGLVNDEAHGLYRFIDCVGQSQNVTGNVSSQNLSTPTIGLDCSAFVSSAYGLTNKVNSARFYSGTNVDTWYPAVQWKNLQSMDMVVKNGHVLLFKQWNQYNVSFYTIESIAKNDGTSEDGKVLTRLVYVNDLKNSDYICRRPSSWGCTHPSVVLTYQDYTVYNHKKICTSCGVQWLETHTTYNGGACTKCGRINCVSPNSSHDHEVE